MLRVSCVLVPEELPALDASARAYVDAVLVRAEDYFYSSTPDPVFRTTNTFSVALDENEDPQTNAYVRAWLALHDRMPNRVFEVHRPRRNGSRVCLAYETCDADETGMVWPRHDSAVATKRVHCEEWRARRVKEEFERRGWVMCRCFKWKERCVGHEEVMRAIEREVETELAFDAAADENAATEAAAEEITDAVARLRVDASE